MNTQSQMINSSSPADPPLKRKRGRPRKDESLVQAETIPATPIVDNLKKDKQCAETTAVVGNEMVGQVVSGVIEGSFDAGYLLKVKVGDSDTYLRGVVFLPGRFAPLTDSNDVAPEAKMYRRTEMPIPVQSPPVPGPAAPSEHCDKQAMEAQNFPPMLEVQVLGLTSELQFSIPIAPENQPGSSVLALTDSLPPVSSAGSSFGGGVAPQPILESGLGSSSASIMPQMGTDKFAEQNDLLKEFEASLRKVPNSDAAAIEQSKLPPPSVLTIDRSPDRTVNLELQIQHQAADNDLKPSQPDHGVESQDLEQNPSSISTKSAVMSAETIGIGSWIEKPASPMKPSLPELPVETISGNDISKLNGEPESHATNNAEIESTSVPLTSLPVTLFEREPMPSAPKPAAEGSILQMMIQPQLCISSGTENMMKVDSTPVNLFERPDPPSEAKLVSDKPEPQPQHQFCSSSGVGEGCDSTNRIVGDQMKIV